MCSIIYTLYSLRSLYSSALLPKVDFGQAVTKSLDLEATMHGSLQTGLSARPNIPVGSDVIGSVSSRIETFWHFRMNSSMECFVLLAGMLNCSLGFDLHSFLEIFLGSTQPTRSKKVHYKGKKGADLFKVSSS